MGPVVGLYVYGEKFRRRREENSSACFVVQVRLRGLWTFARRNIKTLSSELSMRNASCFY